MNKKPGESIRATVEWQAPRQDNYALAVMVGRRTSGTDALQGVYQQGYLVGYAPSWFQPVSFNTLLRGLMEKGIYTNTLGISIPKTLPFEQWGGGYYVLVTLGYWTDPRSNVFTPDVWQVADEEIIVDGGFPVTIEPYVSAITTERWISPRGGLVTEGLEIPNLGPIPGTGDTTYMILPGMAGTWEMGTTPPRFEVEMELTDPGGRVYRSRVDSLSTMVFYLFGWSGFAVYQEQPGYYKFIADYYGVPFLVADRLPGGEWIYTLNLIHQGEVIDSKTRHFIMWEGI